MLNITKVFVQKTDEKTEERARSTLERTMRSEEKNDV